MQIFFYSLAAVLTVALAAALWVLSSARKKLAASKAEAEILTAELASANWRTDKVATVFSSLEEEAGRQIEQLAARNEELERLLRDKDCR